jgi:long-chain acyl-CoA synthetase
VSETLIDVWRRTAAEVGAGPLLYHFDTPITASKVRAKANALASHFLQLGLAPDDRVAICLQNDPPWLTVLLASWQAGLIVVPLNPMIRQAELHHYLADSGARVLVTTEDYLDDVASGVLPELALAEVLVASGLDNVAGTRRTIGRTPVRPLAEVVTEAGEASDIQVPRLPDDVALLAYTSGTTGPPKGAMNTHGNMRYSAEVLSNWYGIDRSDVIWAIAPFFHITGLTTALALTIYTGAPMVMFHRFEPATAMRYAERWRATFCVGAITAYIAMMSDPGFAERDLSQMTKVFTGGAPVSPATVDRFEQLTGTYIHNGYGLTESTGPATFTPRGERAPTDTASGALSVGVPLPGMSVELVDPETRALLKHGEVGEVVLSGPLVVAGYWNRTDETDYAMPQGRLHTGDIGFVDNDGWLFIVDRAKDQINASGFKVWPREVEEVLFTHPAVLEAAVIGRPDSYRGETIAAYIVLRPGEMATAEELTEFCRSRLAAYKRPRSFDFVTALPKTLTGKVLRRTLRGEAQRSPAEP